MLVEFYADLATGSARFTCDLGDEEQVTGDVSFASCGHQLHPGPGAVQGMVEGHGPELGDWALKPTHFAIDQGRLGGDGLDLWDDRNPRVALSVEGAPASASILEGGSTTRMRLVDTGAPLGRPLQMDSKDCDELTYSRHWGRSSSGSRRYWGSLRVDCKTPAGGRIKGSVSFDQR